MPLILKIELDDLTKCDGCPCLRISLNQIWYLCGLGHIERLWAIQEPIRPQACIDAHDHGYNKIVEEVLAQFDSYTTNCTGCKKEVCIPAPDHNYTTDISDVCDDHSLICREKLVQAAEEIDKTEEL